MNVLVVGGGPAGLTLAYCLKQANQGHEVHVHERKQPDMPAGWGITLAKRSLECFGDRQAQHCDIERSSLVFEGRHYLETPTSIITIARDALLKFALERCVSIGVDFHSASAIDVEALRDCSSYDVVVGADGVHSTVRQWQHEAFGTSTTPFALNHVWLATPHRFGDCLLNMLVEHRGVLFSAWGYQFNDSLSSFIVECTDDGLVKAGLAGLADDDCLREIATIFGRYLDGDPVLSGGPLRWAHFASVVVARWHHDNVVLLGDAAHTTHYSKGFGTLLAIDDAVVLAKCLTTVPDVSAALRAYDAERRPAVTRFRAQAMASHNWHANLMRQYDAGGSSAILSALQERESNMHEHRAGKVLAME